MHLRGLNWDIFCADTDLFGAHQMRDLLPDCWKTSAPAKGKTLKMRAPRPRIPSFMDFECSGQCAKQIGKSVCHAAIGAHNVRHPTCPQSQEPFGIVQTHAVVSTLHSTCFRSRMNSCPNVYRGRACPFRNPFSGLFLRPLGFFSFHGQSHKCRSLNQPPTPLLGFSSRPRTQFAHVAS